MNQEPDHSHAWQDLAELINTLPPEVRQTYLLALRSLAHDLRASLGQVQSAQRLLRRQIVDGAGPEALFEMLDVIRSANARAQERLDEFATTLIEEIDTTSYDGV